MKVAFKIAAAMILGIFIVLIVHGHRQVEQASISFERAMRDDQLALGRLFRPTIARVWRTEGEASVKYLVEYTNQTLQENTLRSARRVRWIQLDGNDADTMPSVPVDRLAPVRQGYELTTYGEDGDYLYTYIPLHVGPERTLAGVLEISSSLAPLSYFIRDTQ